MTERKRLPAWGRRLLAVSGLLAALALAFVAWGSTPARPMPEALAAVESAAVTVVDSGGWLSFLPGRQPTTAFILYPGGRVDHRAYAPAAEAIAARGYPVFLVRMPLNLAVLDPDAAEAVIAAHPGIEHWAIGGHSLGGAMAASFADTHPGAVDGLVLWAAYPAGGSDLSGSGLRVLSISASLDGLSTPDRIAASAALLPAGTTWVQIEGGNHAGFGWYGSQSGDNSATISRTEQQAQIVEATLALLAELP